MAEKTGTSGDPSIDRTSYVPVYRQLSAILEQAIAAGECRVGDRLPSESEICATHGVSRMTARRAISVLIDRGLVRPERGRGVFVEPLGLPRAQFSLDGLKAVFAGDDAGVSVLEAEVVEATALVADELRIDKGAPVLHVRSVLTRREQPIASHEAYLINEPALLEAERDAAYLRGLLGRAAVESPYRSGILELQTAVLGDSEARILARMTGSAAWVLEHTFYAADGRPLSWGRFLLPSELLHFPTRIGLASEALGQIAP